MVHPEKELNIRTYVFIDLSNLLSIMKEIILPKKARNRQFLVLPEDGNALADFIYKITSEVRFGVHSYLDKYLIRPTRIYCYGSFTESERYAFDTFRLKLKELTDSSIYLIKRARKGREKTVDVKLAVDLISYAIGDQYDLAILVTGDADFIPAIEEVKRLGKKVYVYYFLGFTSLNLINAADRFIEISYSLSYVLSKIARNHMDTMLSYVIDSVKEIIDEVIKALDTWGGSSEDAIELKKMLTQIKTDEKFKINDNLLKLERYLRDKKDYLIKSIQDISSRVQSLEDHIKIKRLMLKTDGQLDTLYTILINLKHSD